MLQVEKNILKSIEKHATVLFFLAAFIVGCLLRIAGFHFVSGDAKNYLLKWYDQIAVNGISAQVGNYNLPYQTLIYILTKLPIKPLHAYKVVSCAFDLAMSLLLGGMVWSFSEQKKCERAVMAFALFFCSPIVLMNSAVWAQCDAIYTFFGILSLFLLFHEKYSWSMIAFGAAFAFKLQAIFLLPFFLIHYLYTKKWSILYFIILPIVMVALSLPGLIAGRDVLDIFRIYLKQTNIFPRVYVNFPNVYTLLCDAKGSGEYTMFRTAAVLLTVLLLGAGLLAVLKEKTDFRRKEVFFGLVLWSLYTCFLFLPNMHERYAYLLETLSIFYAFLTPVGLVLAVGTNLFSVITYGEYLFDYQAVPLSVVGLTSLLLYLIFSYWFWQYQKRHTEEISAESSSTKSSVDFSDVK